MSGIYIINNLIVDTRNNTQIMYKEGFGIVLMTSVLSCKIFHVYILGYEKW